jgi:hypothetical protein
MIFDPITIKSIVISVTTTVATAYAITKIKDSKIIRAINILNDPKSEKKHKDESVNLLSLYTLKPIQKCFLKQISVTPFNETHQQNENNFSSNN